MKAALDALLAELRRARAIAEEFSKRPTVQPGSLGAPYSARRYNIADFHVPPARLQ